MPIRVAFNATPVLSPMTGIGNYIVELGAALAAIGEIDAYSFYRFRWRHESPTAPTQDGHGARASVIERLRPWVPFRGTVRQVARHLGFARGLRRYNVDLYHEQNYVPLSYDVPVVITIHDLSWLRYPEAHPLDRVRWLSRGVPQAIDRARRILVDSDFVRNEVLATFNVDSAKVQTTHLGVQTCFCPRDADGTARTLHPLGLRHGSYVLTVGTIEPRKNLGHMLEAHALLPSALRERFPLVIAGAAGWHSSRTVTRLRSESDPCVRFLGYVDRQALPDLYAGAALFAFASLYEGFGLPPLEAMASGVPVVVSERASLPEVVGDAGVSTDPMDPEATANKLRALLEDPLARADLAARGLERARAFTWSACARTTLAAYRAALATANPPA